MTSPQPAMSPLQRLSLTLRALLEASVVLGLGIALAALSIVYHGLVYASGARLLAPQESGRRRVAAGS